MRFFNKYFSTYYNNFCKCFPNTPEKDVLRLAALELANLAIKMKNEGKV